MAGLVAPPPPPQPVTPPSGGSSTSNSGFQQFGNYTVGIQPAGNNYPTGIYGVGPGGSGTAVGTLQNNSLTSYNLNQLTNDPNSAYMAQARQQGVNTANQRGLLNGSIAAGNSEAEAIKAALPIATSDAQASLSLQENNLGNLSKAQTATIGANAQTQSAGIMAGAEMNVAQQNNAGALLRQQDNLAYSGEQAALNYQRALGMDQQQFYNNSALSAQGYQQNLGLDQFNLGATLLQGQQNFFSQAGIQAMNDPAIMGDPQAFGGYLQFLMNPFSQSIDNVFSRLFGSFGSGGVAQPGSGG
jgi:hypothetical protein